MSTNQIMAAAGEAYAAFEKGTRDDGSVYYKFRDDRPEWVYDAVYSAHGAMLPDDYVFDFCREAFGAIHDAGGEIEDLDHEFADGADMYTATLLAWLGSHSARVSYCDDGVEELGATDLGLIDRISLGQYMERREVFGIVSQAVSDYVEESDDDGDE